MANNAAIKGRTSQAATSLNGNASGHFLDYTNFTNSENASPTFSTVGATTFTGNLTGDVTGNLAGNVTGNVTGNITGNITGDVTGNVTSTGTSTFSGTVNLSSATVNNAAFNLTGNVVGDLTGNVNGTVTGNVTGNVTSTGTSSFSNIDVNGGAIDGAIIGANSAAAGTFTTVTATSFSGDGSALTGIESLPSAISVNGSAPDSSLVIGSTGDITTTGKITPGTYKPGEIIETIAAIADGRTVSVLSGDYTMTNVTAVQSSSTSYADMNGSSISYTPPSGTNYVVYEYQFKMDVTNNSGISHYILLVDGTEVIPAYKNYSSNYASSNWHHANLHTSVYWVFDLTAGSDDAANGKFASWTSAKALKCQFRGYSTGYTVNIHSNVWRDGSGASSPYNLTKPMLRIQAIA